MGREQKGKGVNVALGPMINIGRVAEGGRNWEGFGADPFLTGEMVYETILGMQQGGVIACAKHLIGKYVLLLAFVWLRKRSDYLAVNRKPNASRRALILMIERCMRYTHILF